MRIERSKYASPPSPVEAFRRVSSKIGRKFNEDDSNHRLLDHSSWHQSDDQYDDDILPFNPTGKFVRKTTTMSPLTSLPSPRNMKKALMSRVNAAAEHNNYFGYQESRDDEANHGLLSRDGQREDRWSDAGGHDDEQFSVQTKQINTATTTKPLLPDLVDLGGFSDSSESTESSEENLGVAATDVAPSSINEQERDGASARCSESDAYSVESVEEVETEELPEAVDDASSIDFDAGVEEESEAAAGDPEVEAAAAVVAEIELEGSSSTVDFDDDLSLAETPVNTVNTIEHQSPVEEESERKSINSSPTDVNSYASYTRPEWPVVVSSSEHGDVILLSPKGFETTNTAEVTLSVPSLEKEDEPQDLSNKFEAIALADPSVVTRQDIAVETEQAKIHQSKEDEKTDSDGEDDEFVISDDWSEDGSVGTNSSDPFGECVVNESVVKNITEHRFEDSATFLGREKKVEEERSVADHDSSSEVSEFVAPVSEASYELADLETNDLTTKSTSSNNLASFNQIWEGSTKQSEESGSDSDESEESKRSGKNLVNINRERSVSNSTGSVKSDSSRSEDKDSFICLNNYWASEWNDLTCDDSNTKDPLKAIQDSLNEEVASSISSEDEGVGAPDKYATANEEGESIAFEEEDDSDEFYGSDIVEGSGDYSYDSYGIGLETISEEGEFYEDEPAVMPLSFDESKKEDEAVVETVLSEEERELVSDEAEKVVDEAVVATVKECTVDEVEVPAGEFVSLTSEHRNVSREEEIVVETVDEYCSDDEESKAEESSMVQTIASNDAEGEVLYELWSKIDEYQANGNNVEVVEEPPRQTISTKTMAPVKKHVVVKHCILDSERASLPRGKRAVSTDPTFDDLSKFLDGQDETSESNLATGVNASLDSLETSNHTQELFEDDNVILSRTSVKRHLFSKLIAPVSALVKRRSNGSQDVGLSKAVSDESKDHKLEEPNVESEEDRDARELAELLSAAMMAREQAKMEKAIAFAKQLAEIQEAVAMEDELAEIDGGYEFRNAHDNVVTPVESNSSSDEDDSQIEILDEELVTPAAPTKSASNESNEIESKDLKELWLKIDEYQASGKSMDTTQVAMMAKMLNSQIEECQTAEKTSNPRIRSSKHAVSIRKRAVVNAKAKKSKYDVSYIETNSIIKNKKATEADKDFSIILEPSVLDELTEESKYLVEPSALPDLETQQTYEYESAELLVPSSALSLNSFASMISADKSSESLGSGGVSKAGSNMSKGSLVSKLYSDNTDLAETLAETQFELEKATKELERMKTEKDRYELIACAEPDSVVKSSFDEYFEQDALEEVVMWYEQDLENSSDLCEI